MSRIRLRNNNSAFALITVYLIWYGFLLAFSTFNFYELHEVSQRAYCYQLLGMVMIAFGFLIPSKGGTQSPFNRISKSFNLTFEKSIWFRIIILISLIYVFYVFIAFQGMAAKGWEVRTVFFEERAMLFGHRYLGMIWTWVGTPLFYLITILLSIRIIHNKLINFWNIIYIAFVCLFAMVGAGRMNFVIIVQIFIIAYMLSPKISVNEFKQANFSKIKKSFLWLMFICLSAIFIFVSGYITSLRRGRTDLSYENIVYGLDIFISQIIIYNIGPFRAFDYGLSTDYLHLIGPLYGTGTLSSVGDLIFTIFAACRLKLFTTASILINSVLQENIITIGTYNLFNYAYTQFMIFYLDFGVLGIVGISFLFGFFYRKAVNYFMYNPNLFSLFLTIYLTICLINSNFAYQLQSLASLLIIVGTLILSRRTKSNQLRGLMPAPHAAIGEHGLNRQTW